VDTTSSAPRKAALASSDMRFPEPHTVLHGDVNAF
jgi:hypothetical protein